MSPRSARIRRWLFLGVASAAAIACGLDIVGSNIDAGSGADAGGVDASTSIPSDAPTVVLADVGADVDATDVDAAVLCVPDGGFCDVCDPELVLCVRFDGRAVDESRYHHVITFDGGEPTYLDGGALSFDGGTTVRMLTSAKLRAYDSLTIEMRASVRVLPDGGTRYGLVDRENGGSFFLYGGVDGGEPFLRCNGENFDAAPTPGDLHHLACVVNGTTKRVAVYVDGRSEVRNEAGAPKDPVANLDGPFLIGSNDFTSDASTPDHLMGSIQWLRIYTRAKQAADIRATVDSGF